MTIRAFVIVVLAIACGLLAACSGRTPRGTDAPAAFELRLPPASLGHDLALQQQLRYSTGQEQHTLDALLEVESNEVRLDLQATGQTALRLRWDGRTLDQHRASWLPRSVSGEQILSDLQLANWPVAAIRAALPSGWSLAEDGTTRVLRDRDATVVTVRHPAPDRIEIEHATYRLSIVSVPVQSGP